MLEGHAAPELLATYQTERHPVAWFAAKHSMTGPGTALLDRIPMKEKASEFYPIVGYRYRSRAVISEDDARGSPDEIALLDREELTGVPGSRVPHVWVQRGPQRISTLDLLDGRFVLLAGSDGAPWSEAAARAAASLGAGLAAYRIGPNGELRDSENEALRRLGVSTDGAVLLRPDGFVAWRSPHRTPRRERLEEVLSHILCRSTTPARRPPTTPETVSPHV